MTSSFAVPLALMASLTPSCLKFLSSRGDQLLPSEAQLSPTYLSCEPINTSLSNSLCISGPLLHPHGQFPPFVGPQILTPHQVASGPSHDPFLPSTNRSSNSSCPPFCPILCLPDLHRPYISKTHKHFLGSTFAPIAYLSKTLGDTVPGWPPCLHSCHSVSGHL